MNQNNFLTLWASKGRLFLVTLFFVMFASALFWLDTFRSYETEMSVLVIRKSASVDTNQVADTLASLSRNLSFYDRLLSETDLIDDVSLGMTQDKRKAFWNEMVKVTRDGQGSVLVVRARADEPQAAKALARQTVQTILSLSGFYYDVKTDIDLRIVDGPITKTIVDRTVVYILTSVVSAVAITGFFFFLLSISPTFFGKKRQPAQSDFLNREVFEQDQTTYDIGESVPYIDPRKFIPSKPTTLSFETQYQEIKEEVSETRAPSVKAKAPSNLPVADDGIDLPVSDEPLPFTFEETSPIEDSVDFPTRGEHEISKESVVLNKTFGEQVAPVVLEPRGEPTAEEYKRRLNQLLAGGK